jgi:predicted PurR-regulated permease PerM
LFWRIYYAVKKNNYLKASTILIFTCSIFATILNIEGSNCLNKINSLGNESQQKINKTDQQIQPQKQVNQNQIERAKNESFELLQYCFLVTNLFIYSLYGIIIGVIIIIVWYLKYNRIWSRNIKKIDK